MNTNQDDRMQQFGGDRPFVAVAANRFSGSGANAVLVDQLAAQLRSQGLECVPLWSPEDRRQLAQHPRFEQCHCVVAAGGDGTVADTINDLPGRPLAILPLGNENLLARHLGFDRDVTRLTHAIARARLRPLDLCQLQSDRSSQPRRFSLMLGVGLDGQVVHAIARWRAQGSQLRRVRRSSYFMPLVRSLLTYAYPTVELEVDGDRIRGAQVLIINVPQYGLGLRFLPEADIHDGCFDWIVFERGGPLPTMSYLLSVVGQKHLRRPDVRVGRARFARITSDESAPVQIDGDVAGATPVSIEALYAAVEVIQT